MQPSSVPDRPSPRLEDQLRQQSAWLDGLFLHCPLAMVAHDEAGRVRTCNAAFERMFGYTIEELRNRGVDDCIAPPDLRAEAEQLTRSVVAGKYVNVITRRRRKDGLMVVVELHGVPLQLDGRIIGAYGLYQDATKRPLLEEALIACHELDCHGIIRQVNYTECRLLGREAEELVGRPIWDLVPPQFRESTRQSALHRLQGVEALAPFRRQYLRADGSILIAETHERLINDAAGNIVGVRSAMLDVTESVRAQERLRCSEGAPGAANEEEYRMLFEDNPHPMWVLELSTSAFLAVNEAAVRHYGYSRDDFLSMTAVDIRPPEYADSFREFLAHPPRGLVHAGVWKHRKKDGTVIDVEITAHTLSFAGREAALVLANDVTERRRLEEQLRRAQKIEAVGRLAGGVAHDFNNLLTIINGYSELLLQRIDAHSPHRRHVERINKAGERAASLTKQLLAFSRRQIIQPSVLDMNAVITGSTDLLVSLVGTNIELVTMLDARLGKVCADRGQIEQVLFNLVVNARDALPSAGGKITVSTANVELDQAYARRHLEVTPGWYVMMAVADTGSGMTEDVLSHIFEPFFTTKELGKGTGLGLASVYGIVKQSGGNIWVYSEPGHGTVFKIYFPRLDESASPAAHEHQLATAANEVVLLVENEDAVRLLVKSILESNGYKVLQASRASEARQLADQHDGPIHLLLTDVIMPEGSGRHLAQRLTADRPDLRVMYMSGYTDDAVVHHGVLEAGVPFLQKPFRPADLLKKVRDVLAVK